MRKYLWIGIAGILVIALIVAGVIFIPGMFNKPLDDSEQITITPGHWWKSKLNDEQIEQMKQLFGKDITSKQFLAEVCPDALQELPPEVQSIYETMEFDWTTEKWEDINNALIPICFGKGVNQEGQMIYCSFYLGPPQDESTTLKHSSRFGLVDDNSYRISLYIDKTH